MPDAAAGAIGSCPAVVVASAAPVCYQFGPAERGDRKWRAVRPSSVRIWLDEERQLVCQRIEGALDVDAFALLLKETSRAASRLRDRRNVRVLVDGRTMGRPAPEVRRLALGTFDIPELSKFAVWGAGPTARAIFRFMNLLSTQNKLRLFATEREALEWLGR